INCGSTTDPARAPASRSSDDGGAPASPASKVSTTPSYGEVYALETAAETANGQHGYLFAARLAAPPTSVDRCAGAALTSGACCFIAAAPSEAGAPTGFAGQNPDGGPSFVEPNAGTLTLTNTSSGKDLSSLSYGPVHHGFGYAEGYPDNLLND